MRDMLLQLGYMQPLLSDRGKNIFAYLGLSALGGYEELNEEKSLLPDGAALLGSRSIQCFQYFCSRYMPLSIISRIKKSMKKMTKADTIFRELTDEEYKPFSHFSWEGEGAFAFYRMSDAYWDAAKVLLDKMKSDPNNIVITDGLIYPLFFSYRHSVETYLKALLFNHGTQNEKERKKYIDKGHSLKGLWEILEPCLSNGVNHVGSSISLDAVKHYIHEIHRFDPNSMVMRYPITRKLVPHPQREEEMRLDFMHFADCMDALCGSLRQLDDDISGQVDKMATHIEKGEWQGIYIRYQDEIDQFLSLLKEEIEHHPKRDPDHGIVVTNLEDLLPPVDLSEPSYKKFLRGQEPDMLILLEVLYYVGRSIKDREVRLAVNPEHRIREFIQLCKERLEADNRSFGQPIGKTYLRVQGDLSSTAEKALSTSISILKTIE